MYELFFLRHGESEGVRKQLLQGRVDFPLTDPGRKQIESLARYWFAQRISFDQIFTSPLKRARESAQIIAAQLNSPQIIEEEAWIERDFGRGEGASLQEIAGWYTDRSWPTAFEPLYETGETEWQIHLRAGKALQMLLQYPHGRYLIVSHGNLINAVLHVIFGILPSGCTPLIELALEPGCYAQVNCYTERNRWRLVSFNEHAPLGG
jgi:broad specificity phosphatase PhoE